MLMIPLPFVVALFTLIILMRELFFEGAGKRNGWFIAFLCLLIFQEMLVGLRFGYGQEWLRNIQPLSAALLPPLGYLSFKRPELTIRTLLHLLPLLGVICVVLFAVDLLDAVLAASNIAYAIALIRLGLRGSDALTWVEISRARPVQMLLWLAVGVLVISGVTDAAITYDFWTTRGTNTGQIVGWASVIGLLLVAIGFGGYRFFKRSEAPQSEEAASLNLEVFEKLNLMMDEEKLYLDPDINLNRIARRMVSPTRDISRAVNACSGGNVSQYVNKLRIEHACSLLQETDMPIIQVAFSSGFNTKSNFNREFARIKFSSPSQWREGNGS